MYALDEKDLNPYRKYVKEKLAALPSLLAAISPKNFPALDLRISSRTSGLLTFKTT